MSATEVFSTRAALLLLVVGLGCGAPGPAASRAPIEETRASAPVGVQIPLRSASRLRVMSFNVRNGARDAGPRAWDERLGLMIERITVHAPDVLGLQEASAAHLDELAEALPRYGFLGVGNADGDRAGVCNGIAFLEERLEVIDRGIFWLSGTPDEPGSATWGNREARAAAWAILRDRHNGRRLLIYNTHLDHASAPARARGLELIGRDLETRAAGRLAAVVLGDFNLDEDDPALIRLLSETALRDTYRETHPTRSPDEASYHAFTGARVGRRIDFVLVTGDVRVIDSDIVHPAPGGLVASDHFAVVATVQLPSVP